MTATATALLDSPVVLEQLLLNLSGGQLLRARGVCAYWKGLIDRKTSLQVRLGRTPQHDGELYCRRVSCQRYRNTETARVLPVHPDNFNPLVTSQEGNRIRFIPDRYRRDNARYGAYYRDHIYLSCPSATTCELEVVGRFPGRPTYNILVQCDYGIDCYEIDAELARYDFETDDYSWFDFYILRASQEGFDYCQNCQCFRCQEYHHDQPGAHTGRYEELGGIGQASQATYTTMVMR
ncbi:hypothetical protein KVT40_004731 [Elsinoe batatas]|uniref:F-box domain-containing protein n=1 Tax=Elsinoe batatas TaxID=2601811 RepID=A0A8K0L7P2_9PEZI|nr:hypothetical protein KVT40_004731 [Elsinoe batatas]